MARMIDGDKLVENLRLIATCWSISPFVSKEKHNGAVDMLREVEREVKEAPTLTPPNEWVSVEERLPEDKQIVLFHQKNGFIYCAEYFAGNKLLSPAWFIDNDCWEVGEVTHWMPLPAPPGKGNNVPTDESLTPEQLRASPHGKIKDSTLQSICNRANEIACRPPEGEEK